MRSAPSRIGLAGGRARAVSENLKRLGGASDDGIAVDSRRREFPLDQCLVHGFEEKLVDVSKGLIIGHGNAHASGFVDEEVKDNLEAVVALAFAFEESWFDDFFRCREPVEIFQIGDGIGVPFLDLAADSGDESLD